MRIYKCLVISGAVSELMQFELILKKIPFLSNVKITDSYTDALGSINHFFPNVIFIDSQTLTDEEILTIYTSLTPRVPIILLVQDSESETNSFSTGIAVDFITKPYKIERLATAIKRAFPNKAFLGVEDKDSIFLKVGRSFKKFLFEDITYLEAYGVYIKLHTEKGKVIVNESISKLEERLINHNFLRVHKSYIINTKKVELFDMSHFELNKGIIVPIGPRYKQNVEGLLNTLFSTSPQ